MAEPGASLKAGLNCGALSSLAWPMLENGLDLFVSVEDDRAREAMRALWAKGIESRQTSAAATAGLLELRAQGVLHGARRVLVLSTEGATDHRLLAPDHPRPAAPADPLDTRLGGGVDLHRSRVRSRGQEGVHAMPSPSLGFATTLQDARRLDRGLAFGDVLDELVRCIPFVRIDAPGESIEVARVIGAGAISSLAGWRAAGGTPTKGTPTDASFSFTLRRLDSLREDDITVAHANRQPNDFESADHDARRAAIVRKIAVSIVAGLNDDSNGFLGWENMTSAQGNRTDVAPSGAVTAAGLLETLLRMDDACATGMLGDRATAFVTTALGRRNLERAAQATGFELHHAQVHNLPTEVPYYRGRPVLVASGLTNDTVNNQAPIYAVDFTYVFVVASTGSAEAFCIEELQMGLQDTGSRGELQWFHGACVVRHPAALVRSLITTTLSA